jgi:hypothetical protein
MNRKKNFIWTILLLMVTVCVGPAGQAAQDRPSKEIVTDTENSAPERVTVQSLPCNWSGSISISPEVKCDINRCENYKRTLTFNCSEGFITEVRAERVCSGCIEF